MAKHGSPADAVLAGLGFALFCRENEGAYRLTGQRPEWLGKIWPALSKEDRPPLDEASPFLENFLIDAEECWREGGDARAVSGPWIETDANGAEVPLEATALTVAGQALLLLERLGDAYETKKNVLQRARETVIAHQRLRSEIQKKEILLHCVAEEMTAALANIITSLQLIEMEENGARTRMLLGLAMRASEEQQRLIQRVLEVFAQELNPGLTNAGAESRTVLAEALEIMRPLYLEKGVRLEEAADGRNVRAEIALAPGQFERLLLNLLENALERTPSGGQVVVRVSDEIDSVLWQIEDSGPAIDPLASANLFKSRFPKGGSSDPLAVRLHFCRMTAESAGGELGGETLPEGRNRFWLRLTKKRPA